MSGQLKQTAVQIAENLNLEVQLNIESKHVKQKSQVLKLVGSSPKRDTSQQDYIDKKKQVSSSKFSGVGRQTETGHFQNYHMVPVAVKDYNFAAPMSPYSPSKFNSSSKKKAENMSPSGNIMNSKAGVSLVPPQSNKDVYYGLGSNAATGSPTFLKPSDNDRASSQTVQSSPQARIKRKGINSTLSNHPIKNLEKKRSNSQLSIKEHLQTAGNTRYGKGAYPVHTDDLHAMPYAQLTAHPSFGMKTVSPMGDNRGLKDHLELTSGRHSTNKSNMLQDLRTQSLQSKITDSRIMPVAKQTRQRNDSRLYQSLDVTLSRQALNKTSVPKDFATTNKSIQRLLRESQMQASTVNFKVFKKSDNCKEAYVAGINGQESTAKFSTLQASPLSLSKKESNMMMRQSRANFAEGSQVTLLPSLAQPKGRSPKTLKDTMKHMVTTSRGRNFHDHGLILGSGQPGLHRSKLEESINEKRLIETATSQTVSSGFFECLAQGNLMERMRLNQEKQLQVIVDEHFMDAKKRNYKQLSSFDHSEQVSHKLQKKKTQMRMGRTGEKFVQSSGKNETSFMLEQHSATKIAVGRLSGTDDEDFIWQEAGIQSIGSDKVEKLADLQKNFESLRFEDQARVMRIGLNEKRQDRFLGMFKTQNGEFSDKIRAFAGQTVTASSIERQQNKKLQPLKGVHAAKISPKHSNANRSINIQNVDESVPGLKSQLYRKRDENERSQAGSQLKTGKKIDTRVTQAASLPAPDRGISKSRLEKGVFEDLIPQELIQGQLPKQKKQKIKPYVLPTKPEKVNQQELDELDNKKNKEREEKERLTVRQRPSLMLTPQVTLNSDRMRRRTKRLSQMQFDESPTFSRNKGGNERIAEMTNESLTVSFEDHLGSPTQVRFGATMFSEMRASSSSMDSLTDSLTQSSAAIRENKRQALHFDDKISVTTSQLQQHTDEQKLWMEKLFSKTKKYSSKKIEKSKAKLMQGRSLYDYPGQDVFIERQEKQAEIDLELATKEVLGESEQFGLAMVTHEKAENYVKEGTPLEVKDHIKFLTNQQKLSIGGEQAIFKKDPLNKKPGASYIFDELCQIEARLMLDNSNEFEKRILYQQINKVANVPKIQEQYAEHPEYLYYFECSQDTDTPLPIMSHIQNHTLVLANYTLSSGHCRALNRAAKYLQNQINRVMFDNCGIDDGEMADLLQAFVQFKDFKSIIYRQNDLQDESLEILERLLTKGIPYHLNELRISSCRLSQQITTQLIQAITAKSFLKSFELANAPISEENISLITKYVMSSKHLADLDLSYNDLLPQKMDLLLRGIHGNKKLLQLNISHNNLIEGFSGNNHKGVAETELKVCDHLFSMLRTNKKLIHLDLTATNLSEKAILHILPAVKKAKNLQGIHLSGNPGVSDNVKKLAAGLLKTKIKDDKPKLILSKVLEPETQRRLEQTFLRESIKIKNINAGKRIAQNGAVDDKFIDIGSKLILTRFLHHKEEIPGSKQWLMLTEKSEHCWICDKEMKGYIFWSRDMAQQSQKILDINNQEKINIFSELGDIHAHQEFVDADPKPYQPPSPVIPGRKPKKLESLPTPQPSWRQDPVICGQFTGWKPRPMIRLFDFLQSKEKPENQLDYKSVFKHFVSNFMWGPQHHIENFAECTQHHLKVMDAHIKEKKTELFYDWCYSFECSLQYKKPFFVNSDVIRDLDYDQVYVAPVFAKSGRQVFVIQPGQGPETVELYKTLVEFRTEDVSQNVKNMTKPGEQKRLFKKPVSVFAKWKSDTDFDIKDKCLYEHDYLNWKLDKFVKDPEQRNKIEKIVDENFYMLKSCFIEMASETSFPFCSQLGWSSFCTRAGLIDNVNLNVADVDRSFIAAKLEDGGKVKNHNMIRFMFIEAVCRVGLMRFYNYGRGECSTPADAVALTCATIKKNWPVDMWENWRWLQLYQIPVHETMQANLSQLNALYRSGCKVKRKYLDLEGCQTLFSQVDGIGAAQIQYCFGMCKMTMVFERDKKASPSCLELDIVEFLEMIGRIADFKFKGSELQDTIDLATKIEYIMDELFPIIEVERQDREEEENESDSNDEQSDSY